MGTLIPGMQMRHPRSGKAPAYVLATHLAKLSQSEQAALYLRFGISHCSLRRGAIFYCWTSFMISRAFLMNVLTATHSSPEE
jgi:hypothetical protein